MKYSNRQFIIDVNTFQIKLVINSLSQQQILDFEFKKKITYYKQEKHK